jgi:hypothetical protein
MYKSKLIDTIKHFSSSERREFNDFLKSPFFNKNKLAVQLYQIINASAPGFSEKNLRKEKVYSQLFGDGVFNTSDLNTVMYTLMRQADVFLTINEVMNNQSMFRYSFLWTLNSHFIFNRFDAEYENSKKILDKNIKKNPNLFLYNYLTESVRDQYLGLNNLGNNNENKTKQFYFLDCFYLSSRLKESCGACVITFFVSKNFDFRIVQPLLDYVKGRIDEFILIPLVYIYYELMCLLQKPDKEKFADLLNYISQNENGIEEKELAGIYDNVIAYCHINERNAEDRQFHVFTGLSVYKRLIKINLLFKYDAHPEVTFMNVVNFCLGNKEYQFLDYFIKEFRERIPEDKRDYVCSKAEASVYRIQKNYSKAIEVLASLSSDNLYFQLDIKQALLALYYLSGKMEQFENFTHAFKVFVHRKKSKLSQEQYSLFNNYIMFLSKFFYLKHKRGLLYGEEYTQLCNQAEKELNECRQVLQKEWLADQLSKIKII